MKKWKVCQIGQTDICLHPAMLLYVLYAILMGHAWFMLLATMSIVLHETAHACISILFGQRPESIELSPLGAVMRLEDDNRLPPIKRGMMLLAGPAMTLALCFTALAFAKNAVMPLGIAGMLFMTNLSILMLNMLPVLPLDGGRLLALILEGFMKPASVSRIMRCIGILAGIALVALNIWSAYRLGVWNLSLAFTGCCMMYSASIATMSHAMTELRFLMDRKICLERRGQKPIKLMMALHTQTLRQLVQAIPPHRLIQYTIIEAGSMKTLGLLTEYDVISAYLQQPNMHCGQLLVSASAEPDKKMSNI